MPPSGCHIGHSTATSELRGPFAGVGGQMESGCAAQPSSTGIQPLLSSLPVPCLFIYSFSQAFLFALTLSQCCPTFHSQMFSFLLFFCFGYSLNKDIYYAHTPSVAHTGVFVLEDCNVKAVVPTFWLKTKGIKSAVMASKSGLPGFGRICKVLEVLPLVCSAWKLHTSFIWTQTYWTDYRSLCLPPCLFAQCMVLVLIYVQQIPQTLIPFLTTRFHFNSKKFNSVALYISIKTLFDDH